MIIEFHLAGENRKKLAWAVAMIIGTTAEYQYMPTCAYKIGECYTVTKSGNLEISDQADREETERLLAELENQGYAVPDTSELESKGLTVQMPADFFTEHTLGNLRQICENKAALFQTAFQTDSLDIIPSDEKVEFPWFMVEQDGDADAYCTFISMLCEFAKNHGGYLYIWTYIPCGDLRQSQVHHAVFPNSSGNGGSRIQGGKKGHSSASVRQFRIQKGW